MTAHESADFSHLGPGPIDIEAAAAVVDAARFVPPGSPDIELDAYAELGGVPLIPPDERQLYLPYVDILAQDSRKDDISRGLGGLGLLVVAPEDVRRFGGNGQRVNPRQLDFAAAALSYAVRLNNRVRTLPIPGQIEGLQHLYPNTDERWANEYAPQLEGLQSIYLNSAVFKVAEQIRSGNRDAIHRRMHALPKLQIEVHLDKNGKPVVVNDRSKNRSSAA